MEREEWREVPSIDGVRASSLGRVWLPEVKAKMPNGRVRTYKTRPVWGVEEKTATGRSGCPRRRIMRIGRLGITVKVHRLVCEAFHGPKPFPEAVVLHLDEDPSNNRASNLRWGSRKENQNFPKAVAAFKARVGDKSPTIIHKNRKGTR